MADIRQVTFDFRPPTTEECKQMATKALCQWANVVRNVVAFLGYVADVPDVQSRRSEFDRLSLYASNTNDQLRMILTKRLPEDEFKAIEQTITIRNQDNLLRRDMPWDEAYSMCNSDGFYQYWHGHAYDERPYHNRLAFFKCIYLWLPGKPAFMRADLGGATAAAAADDGSEDLTIIEIGERPDVTAAPLRDTSSVTRMLTSGSRAPMSTGDATAAGVQASGPRETPHQRWLREKRMRETQQSSSTSADAAVDGKSEGETGLENAPPILVRPKRKADASAPTWLKNVHRLKPVISYEAWRSLPLGFNKTVYLTGIDHRIRGYHLRIAFPTWYRLSKVEKSLVSELVDKSGFHFAWIQFHSIGDAIRFMVGLQTRQMRPQMKLTPDGVELKAWYEQPDWVVNGVRLDLWIDDEVARLRARIRRSYRLFNVALDHLFEKIPSVPFADKQNIGMPDTVYSGTDALRKWRVEDPNNRAQEALIRIRFYTLNMVMPWSAPTSADARGSRELVSIQCHRVAHVADQNMRQDSRSTTDGARAALSAPSTDVWARSSSYTNRPGRTVESMSAIGRVELCGTQRESLFLAK